MNTCSCIENVFQLGILYFLLGKCQCCSFRLSILDKVKMVIIRARIVDVESGLSVLSPTMENMLTIYEFIDSTV